MGFLLILIEHLQKINCLDFLLEYFEINDSYEKIVFTESGWNFCIICIKLIIYFKNSWYVLSVLHKIHIICSVTLKMYILSLQMFFYFSLPLF